MTLSKQRLGEIALLVLQFKLEDSGEIVLNPKSIKKMVKRSSKKLGISREETAGFVKHIMVTAAAKVTRQLEGH